MPGERVPRSSGLRDFEGPPSTSRGGWGDTCPSLPIPIHSQNSCPTLEGPHLPPGP